MFQLKPPIKQKRDSRTRFPGVLEITGSKILEIELIMGMVFSRVWS